MGEWGAPGLRLQRSSDVAGILRRNGRATASDRRHAISVADTGQKLFIKIGGMVVGGAALASCCSSGTLKPSLAEPSSLVPSARPPTDVLGFTFTFIFSLRCCLLSDAQPLE